MPAQRRRVGVGNEQFTLNDEPPRSVGEARGGKDWAAVLAGGMARARVECVGGVLGGMKRVKRTANTGFFFPILCIWVYQILYELLFSNIYLYSLFCFSPHIVYINSNRPVEPFHVLSPGASLITVQNETHYVDHTEHRNSKQSGKKIVNEKIPLQWKREIFKWKERNKISHRK